MKQMILKIRAVPSLKDSRRTFWIPSIKGEHDD